MKNIFKTGAYLLFICIATISTSCKKEFTKPTDLCDCFTFTPMSFADIMQGDARYRTTENEHFYSLIQSYLGNKEARKHVSELVRINADQKL